MSELPGHLLIPGLINAHTHAPMTLMRGLADDLPLMSWLHDHIWPAERRWVDPSFVADGARLAVLEMLLGGVTCYNDMYLYPEVSAQVTAEAGMRAVLGMVVVDFPTSYAESPDDYMTKGLALHDHYRNHPLIRVAFAPHSPYAVSDGPLQRLQTLASELDLPIQIHLHETRDEIVQSLRDHGERPLSRLDRLGLVGPSLVAVHMTQLTTPKSRAWRKPAPTWSTARNRISSWQAAFARSPSCWRPASTSRSAPTAPPATTI